MQRSGAFVILCLKNTSKQKILFLSGNTALFHKALCISVSANKIDEVYASLAKTGSDIYIQRSRQLYQITPLRTKLFTWCMEDVEIVALADTSVHGKDNVVENMRDIDPDRWAAVLVTSCSMLLCYKK